MSKRAWRVASAVIRHPYTAKAARGAAILAFVGCLGACGTNGQPTVAGSLPVVPADIQACFRAGPASVPQKALSVAEVESLWKVDRVHEVVLQRCGKRFLAWYGDVRQGWK